MRLITAFLRIITILGLVAVAAEYYLSEPGVSAIATIKEVQLFLVFLAVILIAIEFMVAYVDNLVESIMTPEQEARREEARKKAWYMSLYRLFVGKKRKGKETEQQLELDHEYDGIRELDNLLPPWWVGLFYATIIFAAIYLVRHDILGADNQYDEYQTEVAAAELAIAEYKANNPDLVSVDNVEQLTDDASLSAGKEIFLANCAVCHLADGGGSIGPNLTDDHWILGGGIKNVFHTILNGGREGKGMVSWKAVLTPTQMQQVASYILSLNGTTPATPKAPEGDLIWPEKEQPAEEVAEPAEPVEGEAEVIEE